MTMADTPEGDAGLSDADLDEIVRDIEGSASEPTEDPGTPDAPPAAEADTATTEAPDTPPAGAHDEPVEVDAQPAEATPAASAPAVTPAGKPFQFTADGVTHALPGAQELPDGSVVIPKDATQDFRRSLASAKALETNFKRTKREYDQKLQAAKSERTNKDIESDAVISLFAAIKKMSPDERWDYFNRFDQEVPKLEIEVQRQQLEREREALKRERNPERHPEEIAEERQAVLKTALQQTRARISAAPELKVLTQDEIEGVFRRWEKRPEMLVVKGEDGQEAWDDTELVNDLKTLIDLKKKFGTSGGAAARNAALNADQTAVNPIPPTVQARKPNGEFAKKAVPKDPKERRKAFLKGDLDNADW